jgi:uncharacterized Zn finger protein
MDAREIANQLTNRGASPECDVCGEGELQVIAESNYALPAQSERGPGVDPYHSLLVAAVVCANCGHVRLHATRALEP